jgi:hypothetical protein
MMQWERVRTPYASCGRCSAPLEIGAPVLVIRLRTKGPAARPKLRCPDCAGIPAPPDLPALLERVEAPKPGGLTPLVFDWKERASGQDREPGEEG